jgi:hypothetical protein
VRGVHVPPRQVQGGVRWPGRWHVPGLSCQRLCRVDRHQVRRLCTVCDVLRRQVPGDCSATAGPGGCEACPRGRFLEGGKCSGCCPAGYPDPDVDCNTVSQLLVSGIVASVEAGKWKKEGVKRWLFTTQASVHSSPTLSPDGESIFVGSFDCMQSTPGRAPCGGAFKTVTKGGEQGRKSES